LGATRADILAYLEMEGQTYCRDESNWDPLLTRNRIRHELLPQLKREWNPQIVDALANLADLAYEEELGSDRARERRRVREEIRRVKGDLRGIEFHHIESVLDLETARLRLPGIEAVRTADGVRIVPARVPAIEVTVPGTYEAPDGASEIRLEPCVNLKAEIIAPLILRGWRPGDHYLRPGKSRDQKIKEMFEDARVPSWRRRFWPILDYGGRIVWARQFGHAEGAPVRVTETLRPHP